MQIQELYNAYLQHPDVQTDTRKIKPGELFFALSGPNFNGNSFAADALNKGAAYAVIDDSAYYIDSRTIVVDNVLATLQALAHYHRQQFKIPFIAITGSNGKTTTKELITAVLRKKYVTYATEGNLNNHIGVPLTLLKIRVDAQMAVIEMGANHQGEIKSYCDIAYPTVGLITNCGKAHIEGFGGIEGVRKGKGELYDHIIAKGGVIFRNVDLDYLVSMAHNHPDQVTYGSSNARYQGHPVQEGPFISASVDNGGHEYLIPSHLVGDYNFPNLMVAIAMGLYYDVPLTDIKDAIETYHPDNSRSQWLSIGSNTVVLDAYNANPTSMRAAILNFAKTDFPSKMLWLGGMKEMGDQEEYEHRELVALVDQFQWANVILVGKEFSGIQKHYLWFIDSASAANYISGHLPSNGSILIKGSRGSRMEKMLDAIGPADKQGQ